MPIGIKFSNFAFSTLAVGCNAAATSLALASGTGAKFPTLAAGEYFYATLENASLDREVVKVTARSTDAITVVRGQDNTTARSWNAGDSIALRLNAGALNDFKTEVVDATNLIRTSNNTFTGTNAFNNTTTFASAPTFGTDLAIADGGTGAGTAATAFDNLKQAATDVYTGVVELATGAEAQAGTDATRVLTPATLRAGVNATGSAPIYAPRAWVNFSGVAATGTYTQSGTTITVTMTAHGMTSGQVVYLDFTSGTAVDGTFTVTVTGANTFTVTAAGSLTTSGNVTRRTWTRASGNVSSVVRNAAGDYTITFTTAMSDANYAVSCGVVASTSITALTIKSGTTPTTTALTVTSSTFDGTAYSQLDLSQIHISIFR